MRMHASAIDGKTMQATGASGAHKHATLINDAVTAIHSNDDTIQSPFVVDDGQRKNKAMAHNAIKYHAYNMRGGTHGMHLCKTSQSPSEHSRLIPK